MFPRRHQAGHRALFLQERRCFFRCGPPKGLGCKRPTRCADWVAQGASMRFVRWFSEVGLSDVDLVGGKNASLGEMFRELAPLGIRVPAGLPVTADASRGFLVAAE